MKGEIVAQENRADVGDERRRADRVCEGNAVVTRIRISNRRIMPARLPIELAGIDDDAAERRAVTADELRRGMHNDVRAVLNRANQVGRAERVVNHRGRLCLWAISAIASMSGISLFGLPRVSR